MEWRGNKILLEIMNIPKKVKALHWMFANYVIAVKILCIIFVFVVYVRCVSSSFLFEFQNWFLDLWADVKLIAAEVDNQIVCGQFVCFLF